MALTKVLVYFTKDYTYEVINVCDLEGFDVEKDQVMPNKVYKALWNKKLYGCNIIRLGTKDEKKSLENEREKLIKQLTANQKAKLGVPADSKRKRTAKTTFTPDPCTKKAKAINTATKADKEALKKKRLQGTKRASQLLERALKTKNVNEKKLQEEKVQRWLEKHEAESGGEDDSADEVGPDATESDSDSTSLSDGESVCRVVVSLKSDQTANEVEKERQLVSSSSSSEQHVAAVIKAVTNAPLGTKIMGVAGPVGLGDKKGKGRTTKTISRKTVAAIVQEEAQDDGESAPKVNKQSEFTVAETESKEKEVNETSVTSVVDAVGADAQQSERDNMVVASDADTAEIPKQPIAENVAATNDAEKSTRKPRRQMLRYDDGESSADSDVSDNVFALSKEELQDRVTVLEAKVKKLRRGLRAQQEVSVTVKETIPGLVERLERAIQVSTAKPLARPRVAVASSSSSSSGFASPPPSQRKSGSLLLSPPPALVLKSAPVTPQSSSKKSLPSPAASPNVDRPREPDEEIDIVDVNGNTVLLAATVGKLNHSDPQKLINDLFAAAFQPYPDVLATRTLKMSDKKETLDPLKVNALRSYVRKYFPVLPRKAYLEKKLKLKTPTWEDKFDYMVHIKISNAKRSYVQPRPDPEAVVDEEVENGNAE